MRLQEHLQKSCKVKTSQCNSCFKDFVQCELALHESDCPEAQVYCAAAEIGCKFSSTRVKAPIHESSCPLNALLPTLLSMSRRMKNQDAALKVLQRRNDELETGFLALQTILGDPPMSSASAAGDIGSAHAQSHAVQPVPSTSTTSEYPPFDSATHHLLSLHESLREELDRVSGAVSQLDARSSMMVMNESLRVKEEMAHTNAVIGSMRMQLQWLMSARLQAQRNPSAMTPDADVRSGPRVAGGSGPLQPVRRLSDSSKELKL